ncbi:MAG: Hint domain-containing protein [Rhodobacteraceae bacterium]|nr:Hint domain-containing protein [Paracoccaceae bacterium]
MATITGSSGNDTLAGGVGNDTITAQQGGDTVFGGAGNDLIYGDNVSGTDQTTSFPPNYVEITSVNQTVTGTNGQPSFNATTTSTDGVSFVSSSTVTNGFWIGSNGVETHTHAMTTQVAGARLRLTATHEDEPVRFVLDGVTINLNTAIANGLVTFNDGGRGSYIIDSAGRFVGRPGLNGNQPELSDVATLTFNVPFTTLQVISQGSGWSAGSAYELFVDTNPPVFVGGADSLVGGDGNDTLFGGVGGDTLSGGLGTDTLNGGTGNDVIFGDDDRDVLIGGTGDDALYGGVGNDTISGGDGNEFIFGDEGADSITGDAGNDFLSGFQGDDLMDGGIGADTLFGGTGADTLFGGDGDDFLSVGGSDQAFGGSGDDVFEHAGDDTFVNAVIDGGSDATDGNPGGTENGNAGDRLDLSWESGSLTVTLGTNPESGTVNGLDGDAGIDLTFSEIEIILTGDGDDTVAGSAATGAVTLNTGAGNDVIATGSGNDSIVADTGNDSVQAGAGNDTVAGGAGNDSLDGGAGADSLIGGAGNDTVAGGDGDDTLVGSAGDRLLGESGDDTFRFDPTATGATTVTVIGGETGEDAGGDIISLQGLTNASVTWSKANKASGSGTLTYLNSNGELVTVNFSEIERVICFARDTLISTRRGDVPVQDLRLGDLIRTVDRGFQPLRWLAARRLTADDLAGAPKLRPIRIRAGALGCGLPRWDLTVSPQHRILVRSKVAERMFGSPEVLVAAKQLLELDGVAVVEDGRGVEYWHLMCDRHEVIFAEGLESETLFPGQEALATIPRECHEELFALFPDLRESGQWSKGRAARPIPRGAACRQLVRRHVLNQKPMLFASVDGWASGRRVS